MSLNKSIPLKCGQHKLSILLTKSSQVVEEWIKRIYSNYTDQNPVIVGLDIEWKPTFSKKVYSKAALIQICVDKEILIIQLHFLDKLPEILRTFFLDKKFLFSGVGIKGDVKRLQVDYGLEFDDNVFNVTTELRQRKPGVYSSFTLENLAIQVGGLRAFKKDKRVRMSNWAREELNPPQVHYAALDAFASYKVGEKVWDLVKDDSQEETTQVS